MTRLRAATALAATAVSLSLSTPVAAYPVDCAILLCLAGGWPASAECAHARAVFIARITPWPVEPPLQIWNCPMRAAYRPEREPAERVFEAAALAESFPLLPSRPYTSAGPILAADQADVDISDPAYDFVRSIHVFQVEFEQDENSDGECYRRSSVRLGTYGEQGDYNWSWTSIGALPRASEFSPPGWCGDYRFRSVFVDWRDFEGTYGFEEVRY